MIDINELRQSAQAATPGPWYIGSGTYEGRNIYSVEAVTDDEGFTYNPVVATAEDDDVVCWEANARLIAAANPAVISELLDRLEAAESDALEQARLNGMGSEREAALMAKLEAAEKDIAVKEEVIDSLAAVVKRLNAQCDAAEKEREMDEERIADLMADLNRVGHEIDALRAKITEMEKQEPVGEIRRANSTGNYINPVVWVPMAVGAKLYAGPGAKGEEK